MNQLQHETSPYLLQHANNPVQWHPWRAETLARAKAEDKPILVSIGYSTCHWCHVMERESFEDVEIADFMNAYFINVKVDREERPDLDALYMDACQILAGTAGWPLNVFLTPDLKPFFAGTYFPPDPGHKRMSWLQVLQYVHYNFQEQRIAVERQADRVMARLADTPGQPGPIGTIDPAKTEDLPNVLFRGLQQRFDPESGGFGTGKKFPNTMALEYLLNYFYYYRDQEALRHFRFTLSTMLKSGLYDQIGGGIARYTVDREWRIPHFEKMLYDNTLFARLLARAYRLIGRRKYKTALLQTISFLERDLRAPGGGFFSALDADSPAGEGRYYTWDKAEIEAVLGDDAELFCRYFGITEAGNWDGTNILYQPLDRFHYADKLKRDREELLESMHAARRKMLAVRNERMPLHRDEKIILSWNALMVSTYTEAYLATGETNLLESAESLLSFLERHFLQADGITCYRTYTNGKAANPATLRDYAFLIRAYLDLFQITNVRSYLERAVKMIDAVQDIFTAPETVFFSYARRDLTDLIRQQLDLEDDEMPSGNAAMLRNLQELGILTGDKKYRDRAGALLAAMSKSVQTHPLAYAAWANALLADDRGILEIAVIGEQAGAWKRQIEREYQPFRVLIAAEEPDDSLPLLAGKDAGDATLIYVCEDATCRTPLDSPEAFAAVYVKPPDLSRNK
ncbi:thioredoxin domain-containing protein [Flavilitoribacter nigricans]|nr:thioredoxin domain-containing protein [Flavilitoribacter nigricans]